MQHSEYNEGIISSDINNNVIKICSIKGNSGVINIGCNSITNVYLNKLMKNIIYIHDIYIKYNSNKEKGNNSMQINRILNLRAIMNIKDLSKDNKIKACLCNFFSLLIEYNKNNKIELIFINYNQFNSWLSYLKDILNTNILSKNFILNGSSDKKTKIQI